MPRRDDDPGVLHVLVWIAAFVALAWLVHAGLFFFPQGWRWTNDDRGRTVWTLRAALSLVLALPLSLWFVAQLPGEGKRARLAAQAVDRAAGVRPDRSREVGCGGIILALVAATLLVRPTALLLFPVAGLPADEGGLLPFLLWGVLAVTGIGVARLSARLLARRG